MRKRHYALGLLFLLSIITYVDRVCISVAGPAMQKDLDMNPKQFGWVVGAFAIAYALFEIPSGAMGDGIGPRRTLARIVLRWSAFTSLTGLVSSFKVLLGVRFLFGMGEAGAYPNCSATISRWFPTTERAWAHGVVWMASRLGGALSPFLVIPIQVGWTALWHFWFRDNPRDKAGVTAGEIDEIGPLKEAGHAGTPWGLFLRSSNLRWIMIMYHTYCWGSFFYLSWLHTFLVKGRGFDSSEVLRYSWLPFAFGGTANFPGGVVSDRLVKRLGLVWGRRSVGMIGLGASAVFIAATMFTQDKVLSVLFLALGYAGSDFMLPVAWAVCLDVGRKHAGAVSGAMNTAGQLGSTMTSVAFGYLVTYYGTYNAPLAPMAVMTAISALL